MVHVFVQALVAFLHVTYVYITVMEYTNHRYSRKNTLLWRDYAQAGLSVRWSTMQY